MKKGQAMVKEIASKLSGAQITLLGLAAILAVPGAVVAAVTYTPVAIVDTTSGKQAHVDSGQKLWTYDYYAALRNNPANFVHIGANVISNGNAIILYTVPAGKALILTSANTVYYNGTSGGDNYMYCYNTGSYLFGFENPGVTGQHSIGFGSGPFLHAGATLACLGATSSGSITAKVSIQGYLVPDNAVPATNSAEMAQQSVQVGSPTAKR